MFYATNTLQQTITNTTQADRNPSDCRDPKRSARPRRAAAQFNQPLEIIGGVGTRPGQFNNPWSIALDSHGNLYVANEPPSPEVCSVIVGSLYSVVSPAEIEPRCLLREPSAHQGRTNTR
jgi:hypothetical protein